MRRATTGRILAPLGVATHRPPPPAPLTSPHATSARDLLRELYDAAVSGVAPGPLTAAALADFTAKPGQRIWLYAFGKAAHAMAASAAATLQRSLYSIAGGLIVAPEPAPSPYSTLAALTGDHPLPGRSSFTAALRIEQNARGMRGDDVAIVLVSGGTSSLIAAPLRGMTEADIGHLFELMLGAGLDIRSTNTIRKRFTRWGAGRLALALAPARTHVLVVSDVPGDDPADVGSGPCSPDVHTVRDVNAILQQHGLHARLPGTMRDYLNGVARGLVPETPKPSHPAFAHVSTRVIASNRVALNAATSRARELSLVAECGAKPLDGDAARCGEQLAETLLERVRRDQPGCIVWGGETTVDLNGFAAPAFATHGTPPTGGRCQELALAAARVLAQAGDAGRRVTILAAGTDGRDGVTDAAGAFADGTLWDTIAERGRDPGLALARHESYGALDAGGALLKRGLTGTNVMDVVIGLVE